MTNEIVKSLEMVLDVIPAPHEMQDKLQPGTK